MFNTFNIYYGNDKNIGNRQRLASLRAQYNKLSTNKALYSVMKLKQTYYDQEERAGKLPAWRLKSMQNERTILEIESEKGTN